MLPGTQSSKSFTARPYTDVTVPCTGITVPCTGVTVPGAGAVPCDWYLYLFEGPLRQEPPPRERTTELPPLPLVTPPRRACLFFLVLGRRLLATALVASPLRSARGVTSTITSSDNSGDNSGGRRIG